MATYDISLRHGTLHGGEWCGFVLGWQGLGGVAPGSGLNPQPYRRTRTRLADPASPGNDGLPPMGAWAAWVWRCDLALLDALTGLWGEPLPNDRTAEAMRADLLALHALPSVQLLDPSGEIYTVRITAYEERLIEPYDPAHTSGGWLATIEMVHLPD